jgi:hypothetical protein
MIANIDRLHELVASMPRLTNVHTHPDIPSIITNICMHQGIASTVLFDDSERGKEKLTTYNMRRERVKYIADRCAHLKLNVLRDRKVRNSLAHIDEYIIKHMAVENTGWFIDCAIAKRDEFLPVNRGMNVGFCRAYISYEDNILHFGNEIHLSTLRDEANDVLFAVWRSPKIAQPQLPGQPLPNHQT